MFLESTFCEKIFTAKVHPEINITEINLLPNSQNGFAVLGHLGSKGIKEILLKHPIF